MALSRTLLLRLCCGCPRIDQLLRLRLEPMRLAKLRLTSLPCDAFQVGVIVQRACYDLIEAFDIPGPEVDAVHRADPETRYDSRMTRHDERRRSRKEVDAQAKRVAKIRWPEEQ